MRRALDNLRLVVAALIVVVWLGLTIAAAVNPERTVDEGVQRLMLLVAGFLFGPSIVGPLLGKKTPVTKEEEDDGR